MPARLMDRWWFIVPLAVFAVSRLVSGVMLAIGASRQIALEATPVVDADFYKVAVATPASPGYLGVVSNWDGQWFRSIAEHGYPDSIPRVGGVIVPNEWAFSGGYPTVVRTVMRLGLDFPMAASVVSLSCFAVALVVLYGTVRSRMDDHAATRMVLAISFFPTSPVFQVAYTEAMTLLLVVLALRALSGRRYAVFLLVAAVLAVTRPLMLPVAALCGVTWLVRWFRRHEEDFPRRERLALAATTVATLALAGLWPLIAAVGTGEAAAFTQSIASWRGNTELGGPGVNWLTLSVVRPVTIGFLVVPLLVVAVFAARRRAVAALPFPLRWWGPIYLVYMLAVTKPNAGILRYVLLSILPLAPLLGEKPQQGRAATVAQWAMLGVLVVVGIVGQYYWVTRVFTIDSANELQPWP
ncbi:hypothetical protein SAMN04489844_4245 [Nocardioides exalbidus]|uniref:Mannosyltransferase (PIG-V) n=1 Tax=Nocardioides exalbidus TaxID=402596 RepID=A0A1H5A0K5_9ACTN|nr:hypothetical protein [Nocardioides exalbidus]SED35635.1 hypothetical protein SAMN04489844_4245 [Nocardioides exalbidus]